jgi:hypothetical protein
MPKRTTRTAKARATTGAPTRETLATNLGFAFQEGDVVLDAEDARRVGRVCSVVTAGRSYQVRFADSPVCMLTPHSAITPAPPTTQGPPCTPDC